MIELLTTPSGPDFLLYIACWGAAVLAALRLGRGLMGPVGPTQPSPMALQALEDPYFVAVLRDGADEAVSCAAVALDGRGYLRLEKDGLKVLKPPAREKLHPLEAAVLAGAPKAKAGYELVEAAGDAAWGFGRAAEAKLVSLGLLADGPERWKDQGWRLAAFALVLGPGGFRLVRGFLLGRPVGFLLMLLGVYTVAAAALLEPRRRTAAGDAALDGLKSRYSFLGGAAKRGAKLDPADEALAAALFGLGGAALGAEGTRLLAALTPPSSSGSDGGCGGGCGGGGCGG